MRKKFCEYCNEEIQVGDTFYEGNQDSNVCENCGDKSMEQHDLTTYDDYPFIDSNEQAGFDGGQYEGEQFRKVVMK